MSKSRMYYKMINLGGDIVSQKSNSRIVWIDVAKGLTIILVIIGHTIYDLFRGMIFSFHMPLFFILSCITYKFSDNNDKYCKYISKSFKHLIIPAYLMFLLGDLIVVVRNYNSFNNYEAIRDFLRNQLLAGVFASGVEGSVNGGYIPAFGIPWFFVALFLGRSIFDYWQMKYKGWKLILVCVVASIIGKLIGRLQPLPLSFDIVLAIIPFFYVGMKYSMLKVQENALLKLLISTAIWAAMFWLTYVLSGNTYLELALRRYPCYPLCLIVSVAGTVMISEASVLLSQLWLTSKTLAFLGRYSLYLLFIHHLDGYLLTSFYYITDNWYINALFRLIEDIFILIIVVLIKQKIKCYLDVRKKYDNRY